MADGINGFLEFNYSNLNSESEDADGVLARTKTENFLQRYNLSLNRKIYPNLTLMGGGIFEQTRTEFKIDGNETESTLTKISPFVDLRLSTQSYNAGISYNRREETQKNAGAPAIPRIRDSYTSILGLKPEGLPTLNIQFSRSNIFDKEHSIQDQVNDHVLIGSRYLIKQLDLRYQTTYSDLKDNLKDLEIQDINHIGNITYSNQYFKKKVSLATNYNIAYQKTKTSRKGTGETLFQAFPLAGLSAIDDTPLDGSLDSNQGLIDGDLAIGSGINIGLLPPGSDVRQRNLGLDFFNETEINTILVWIDREIPGDIAVSFRWNVYTSSDNVNWVLYQTIENAPFGTFENRVEIDFPNVKTRYIKIVVSPIAITVPGATDYPYIYITELQAFLRKPADEVRGSVSRSAHIYNLNVRTRLLDTPSLYHNLFFLFSLSEPSSLLRYAISNALSLSHKFSRVYSINAMTALDINKETVGNTIAYTYSTMMTVQPVNALIHNLVFSGRYSNSPGTFSVFHSFFLNNFAELYKGISTALSGGISSASSNPGEDTKSVIINSGTTLVPHKSMTINLNYSDTATKQSGGALGKTYTFTKRSEVTMAYNPLRAVYLFTSLAILVEKGQKTSTTQSYGANWSPLRDGALLVNISYSENLRSSDKAMERAITPSLRWNMTAHSILDLSYIHTESESVSYTNGTKGLNANLRVSF
ncbi:MAG TPA: hypothetical protein VII00_03420 [bacterium]